MINKDKNKKDPRVKDGEIIALYKSLVHTFFLVMISFFALIFVSVAWFASNRNVSSNPSTVTASQKQKYELGCAGQRSETEENNLLVAQEGEQTIWGGSLLETGTTKKFSAYVDTSTNLKINKNLNLYTSYDEFAWCLPDTISFYPGARGKLEFYVIPRVEGLSSVNVKLDILPCKAMTDANGKKGAVVQENDRLNKLIDGHILFFSGLDDIHGYSGWLGLNPTISISSTSDALSIDTPYKVTVYWIWPKQYRNLIYDKFSTRGDLFANTANNKDYERLIDFINENREFFFYGSLENIQSLVISDQMTQSDYDNGVLYYNYADEYIGKNADYIYLKVTGE